MKTGKNTDVNIRSLVIFHREKGKTIKSIAEILLLKRSTVHDICKRYYTDNSIEDRPRSGRPKKLNSSDEKFVLREVKQNPRVTSSELVSKLKDFSGKEVNSSTIRKRLIKNNYVSRVARRKPLLSRVNRDKRLAFARKFVNKELDFWKRVIFIDEKKFNLYNSDTKQVRVRRKPNTELNKENVCGTVKHGGKNIMVWGAISYNGIGNLVFINTIMNKDEYLKILKENLLQSAEKLGIKEDFYFYQDNDPKHKAWDVRNWLLYNCPHVIETPPQSPDLNVIEHVWAYLEKEIRKLPQPKGIPELRKLVEEQWNKVDPSFTRKLVESMQNRLKEVIKRKGFHTKY